MIQVRELAKYFNKGAIKAVDGASFDCPDGQITGLLGPNGAGKTTLLRMIAGLIKPLRGNVLIDGHDMTTDPVGARSLLGVQSDMIGVYPRLTPREQFRYYGRFYGLKGEKLEEHVEAIIRLLDMKDIADRRAEGFSRGQRQKIVLGRALVHSPHNIIMDEPTNGLDVMGVRETRELIRALAGQGRCVLFTTHYMDEAEKLCDHIAVVIKGKIAAFGTPPALMAQTGKMNLEDAFVEIAGGEESLGLMRSEFSRQLQEV